MSHGSGRPSGPGWGAAGAGLAAIRLLSPILSLTGCPSSDFGQALWLAYAMAIGPALVAALVVGGTGLTTLVVLVLNLVRPRRWSVQLGTFLGWALAFTSGVTLGRLVRAAPTAAGSAGDSPAPYAVACALGVLLIGTAWYGERQLRTTNAPPDPGA